MHENHGLTPHLVVNGAAKAVEFYKAAFGAVEVVRTSDPGSDRLMHVTLKIGESALFLRDDFPEHCGDVTPGPKPGTSVTLHLDVPDCDVALARAAAAGATVTVQAMDTFWGDRYGKVTDPFGHDWSFAHTLNRAA